VKLPIFEQRGRRRPVDYVWISAREAHLSADVNKFGCSALPFAAHTG
jgi:hypothetical protein